MYRFSINLLFLFHAECNLIIINVLLLLLLLLLCFSCFTFLTAQELRETTSFFGSGGEGET